ncbi:MAG: alkaline phosphatase family protein [Verrucomicrobiota bacterium]
MKHVLVTVLALLWATFGTLAAPPQASHVFIISFDQGSPSAIQKAEMPVFKKMAAEGAHTWSAYTIVPSLTLPSHTSMLTGVGIQKHQVLWNDLDPAKGFVKVPTIFSIAKEHGLVTAMYVSKIKFKTLQLPGSLDAFVVPATPDAKSVAEAFATQVGKLKPNLCFIHFGDADVAGHKFGVNSPEKMKAFADCDAALKVIKDSVDAAGLAESSVFILTADHGGHDLTPAEIEENIKKSGTSVIGTHGSPATEDVEIPWVAWGKGVKSQFCITAPVVIYDSAATALWLLGVPVPENFWGRPVTSAFEKPVEK